MKTLAELEALEKAIFNRKEGQSLADAVAEFEAKPKYPAPPPLITYLETTSFQYCEAIRRYMLDRDHPDWIDEQEMNTLMGAKKVVVHWGHAPVGWPYTQ